jgi:hypothetical protein
MLQPGGPGAELKRLLRRFGIVADGTCECNQRAALMDCNGCDWCEQNIEQIVDWLQEESAKRKLPFFRLGGKLLVKLAIRSARKKARSAVQVERDDTAPPVFREDQVAVAAYIRDRLAEIPERRRSSNASLTLFASCLTCPEFSGLSCSRPPYQGCGGFDQYLLLLGAGECDLWPERKKISR